MNNFDEPVKKAETDAEILDALQGVKLTQDEIRRGACGGMGLAFFRAYYEKLPEEVARRLTQREKAERAAMKKQLQARGVLPPDKPRLNRKKFARETWAEWEEFLKSDPIRAEVSLLRAVEFIAGPELPAVTPEQVGVYKALKLAVEYNKFLRKLEAEGRSKYTIGELADEVVLPIIKL